MAASRRIPGSLSSVCSFGVVDLFSPGELVVVALSGTIHLRWKAMVQELGWWSVDDGSCVVPR
jgi:hypothetical protein